MFAALVLETTGGINKEGKQVLRSVFRFGSKRQNTTHCVYAGRAWARLSCNLQSSVAQAILSRIDGYCQDTQESGAQEDWGNPQEQKNEREEKREERRDDEKKQEASEELKEVSPQVQEPAANVTRPAVSSPAPVLPLVAEINWSPLVKDHWPG
ncbi:MAG TPA: hypothetical protein V6C72_05425 [Chroococcales cyanobacterium]